MPKEHSSDGPSGVFTGGLSLLPYRRSEYLFSFRLTKRMRLRMAAGVMPSRRDAAATCSYRRSETLRVRSEE